MVLAEKVKVLAKLILESRNCLVYTGAGISTSSGINDYASRSLSVTGRPVLRSPYEAQPTPAHRTLVAMHRAHLIHYWVQQNHDGLPQVLIMINTRHHVSYYLFCGFWYLESGTTARMPK